MECIEPPKPPFSAIHNHNPKRDEDLEGGKGGRIEGSKGPEPRGIRLDVGLEEEAGLGQKKKALGLENKLEIEPSGLGHINQSSKQTFSELGHSLGLKSNNNMNLTLLQPEASFSLTNFQEAISIAMKEAMAAQLNDWFAQGKGKSIIHESPTNKWETPQEDTMVQETDSQASHIPVRMENDEEVQGEGKKTKDGEVGSSTRIMMEACDQLSRERKEGKNKEAMENEATSPATNKGRKERE